MSQALSRDELESGMTELQAQVIAALAPYEVESAICFWLDTLRGIEELINLCTLDWDDESFERQLAAFPVAQLAQHTAELQAIHLRLVEQFSTQFANRISSLLIQGSVIAIAFAAHGVCEVVSAFQSLGSMIGYFQSRRRHFVGLLHLMATACRGSKRVTQLDTLNIILPIVELSAMPMIAAQYNLMVKLAQERLGIPEDASTELAMLNSFYLEPERASIIEMTWSDEALRMLEAKEVLHTDRLFSAAELRNDILLIEAAYAEFDLRSTEFATSASLVRRLSRDHIIRDYWVQISLADLTRLMTQVGASPVLASALTCHDSSYMKCLSSYAPLVLVGGRYLSTVTLLSRFIYSWRARILDRKKRFQIRAGFIFEDQVSSTLEALGFAIQDIVRINRQEFDVVTIRDDVIWNVQCKNNFVDLESVDSDAVAFARYNHGLVRSYEKALVKERNREHLLKGKLSVGDVQHMVVSRFPVVTNNPRIVVFSRIADFARRADAVLAGAAGDSLMSEDFKKRCNH